VDLSKIPLSEVERIDIIRGSDAARYGESSMGGIVNIVTKDPGKTPQADLSATAGSYGVLDLRGFVSTPVGAGSGLAVTLGQRQAENDYPFVNNNGTENDATDDYDDRRENNAFHDRSYLIKFTTHPGSWDIKLSANGTTAHKEMPGIITFPTPEAWQDYSLRNYAVASQGKLSGCTLALDMGRTDQQDTYHDPQAAYYGTLYSSTATTTDQAQVGLAYPVGILRIEPRLSYLREHLSDNQIGARDRTTRSAGLALSCMPEAIELTGTLRYDDNSEFGGEWSYRAGAAYTLTDGIKIKANAGTGYRVPSFYELYYNHGFIVGNQDLVPEKSFSWDIGPAIEQDFYGLTLNYFQQRSNDLIVYVLQSGLYYKPYNISRAMAQGIEFYAWIEPWEWLKLSGNYTYNQALDESGEPNQDGNQIPGQPRNLANLQVDLKASVKEIPLGMYGAYNYIEGNFITRANTKKLDDRHIVNAGINAAPIKALSVNVEVKNLLDEQVMDLRGFPLEGRSYYTTLRWIF
jgi:vitamin B12 transporter